MSDDASLKRSDQIALLRTCREYTDTEQWNGLFSYPNCGWDLVQSELVTADKKITKAGRAALFLLGDDDADPTPDSQAVERITIPLGKAPA